MNTLLGSSLGRWLLGADAPPADASSLRVVFERPLPGWGWFLALCACALIAWWSYRGLRGSIGGRSALAALRAALLLLLIVLLAGPSLRVGRETIEEDWVVVLADRSRSMVIRDEGTPGARATRESTLRSALASAAPMWSALDAERTLLWLGFADGAFDLAASADPAIGLGEASGDRTRLDDALEQVAQRTAARPVAGIIVFSDGRTSAPPSRATIRRLQAAAAKVFVVPLGSTEARGDIAVAKVDAPRRAFVRDEVPVVVELERADVEAASDATRGAEGSVRLVDAATGETISRVPIPPFEAGESTVSVTLIAKPTIEGMRDWRVELDAGEEDLVAENNSRDARVELIDRPLRVLYIDGYPRWEYRYLKSLLIREESIDSSIMLLSADRDFAQEGNMPLARLPRTAEEFAQFDLVILGDVPSSFFTTEQLEALQDQVAQRGTGLLWIGGERWTPKSWDGTPLAELLPMRPPLALAAVEGAVNVLATPAAAKLGLMKVGEGDRWPEELANPATGWSRLEWAQAIPAEQLKPTAEALAVGVVQVPGSESTRTTPLIVAMKYGAGEVVYLATDEFWRWRYGRGERYTEQVWLPLVRMLGREALAGGGDGVLLRATPARAQLGQSIRLELVVADARLAERAESSALVQVSDPEGVERDFELVPTTRPGEYTATITPDVIGRHVARVATGPFAGGEVTFECERPDDETRKAAADHDTLAALARETGGAVLLPSELNRLPELLPKRSVVTEQATTEPLWDAPLALLLIVLMATAEWLGRRWMRLA